MELTYRQEGDYLLPNVTVPESPRIGKYGMLRRDFLRKHRDPIYTGMMLAGTLNSHLEETDRAANEMLDRLISRVSTGAGAGSGFVHECAHASESTASRPMVLRRSMTYSMGLSESFCTSQTVKRRLSVYQRVSG